MYRECWQEQEGVVTKATSNFGYKSLACRFFPGRGGTNHRAAIRHWPRSSPIPNAGAAAGAPTPGPPERLRDRSRRGNVTRVHCGRIIGSPPARCLTPRPHHRARRRARSPAYPAARPTRSRRPDTRPRALHMNGSRTVTSVAVEGPMIPSQPQPSKRKATDDANPLAAAAGKKLKRDVRTRVHLYHLDANICVLNRTPRRARLRNGSVSRYA